MLKLSTVRVATLTVGFGVEIDGEGTATPVAGADMGVDGGEIVRGPAPCTETTTGVVGKAPMVNSATGVASPGTITSTTDSTTTVTPGVASCRRARLGVGVGAKASLKASTLRLSTTPCSTLNATAGCCLL
jgi:hypothetical protein